MNLKNKFLFLPFILLALVSCEPDKTGSNVVDNLPNGSIVFEPSVINETNGWNSIFSISNFDREPGNFATREDLRFNGNYNEKMYLSVKEKYLSCMCFGYATFVFNVDHYPHFMLGSTENFYQLNQLTLSRCGRDEDITSPVSQGTVKWFGTYLSTMYKMEYTKASVNSNEEYLAYGYGGGSPKVPALSCYYFDANHNQHLYATDSFYIESAGSFPRYYATHPEAVNPAGHPFTMFGICEHQGEAGNPATLSYVIEAFEPGTGALSSPHQYYTASFDMTGITRLQRTDSLRIADGDNSYFEYPNYTVTNSFDLGDHAALLLFQQQANLLSVFTYNYTSNQLAAVFEELNIGSVLGLYTTFPDVLMDANNNVYLLGNTNSNQVIIHKIGVSGMENITPSTIDPFEYQHAMILNNTLYVAGYGAVGTNSNNSLSNGSNYQVEVIKKSI